jgi:hypothetical protein
MVLSFGEFLTEARKKTPVKSDSSSNTALGAAYEAATALHVHKNSGSSTNTDKKHLARIAKIQKTFDKSVKRLTPEKRKKVNDSAVASGNAYLKSLKGEGINPDDISEVHHTSMGISDLLGTKVSQAKNPPDIAVRLKRPHPYGQSPKKDLHFASLKFTSGTVSNNGTGSMDKLSQGDPNHFKTNFDNIWKEGRRNSGVGDRSHSEIQSLSKSTSLKDKEDYQRLKKSHDETRKLVLAHHKETFDNATLSQQKSHLMHLMKANSDVSYHYVTGEQGGKSVSIEDHPNVAAARNAKGFHTEVRGNSIHFYDHDGKHILSAEHRTTRGPWTSAQVNAKFGTLERNSKFTNDINPPKETHTPLSHESAGEIGGYQYRGKV